MKKLLYPKKIAIFGSAQRFGREFLKNLESWKGEKHIINPKTQYKKLSDAGDGVDLAIIGVKAELVHQILSECKEYGIERAIVISGGFSECGEKAMEKISGMKILGPNCVGFINNDTNLNASFIRGPKYAGDISIITQSGAMGHSIINRLNILEVGISKLVNTGNEADICTRECLEYMLKDDKTKIIGIYNEGIKQGKKLFELVKESKKPIVICKGGRTKEGKKAAKSHTASIGSDYKLFKAAMKNTIITRDIKEFVQVLYCLKTQPLPKGKRGVIITNAGVAAVLCTDALCEQGLELAKLSHATKNELSSFLLEIASVKNPIDVISSSNKKDYEKTLEVVARDENVDFIVAANVLPTFLGIKPTDHASSVCNAQKNNKPVYAYWEGEEIIAPAKELFKKGKIPLFDSPLELAYAVKKLQEHYSKKRQKTMV